MTDKLSPQMKKLKLDESVSLNKREHDTIDKSVKRKRVHSQCPVDVEDINAKKRRNFTTACELTSQDAYFDYATRLQLIYLPSCTNRNLCKHQKSLVSVIKIPNYAEELVKIDLKSHLWNDALEACILCITQNQYLSSSVLRDVVEIMLNAHVGDIDSEKDISYLINKCKQVLLLHFSSHPPCVTKILRKCYLDFLSKPMDAKEHTFSNRAKFGYKDGIVKYIMNRLDYELSINSPDGPFVDKEQNTPAEMKNCLQGEYWQKQNFEIYEQLERCERINRLIAALQAIIELLQFDIAIWLSRFKNNSETNIMRSSRPLMALLLWSEILYTGAVTNNCTQILQIFVKMIHLEYPEDHVRIMACWVNTMIQTCYICEINSISDYPNTGKYCKSFAKEFYKIITDLGVPCASVIKILERIEPTFMRHLVGTLHLKKIIFSNKISAKDDDIIKIFTEYVKCEGWNQIQDSEKLLHVPNNPNISQSRNNITKYLKKICYEMEEQLTSLDLCDDDTISCQYKKYDTQLKDVRPESDIDCNNVAHVIYITTHAYLDAYNVHLIRERWESLNDQVEKGGINSNITITEIGSYTVTEQFIKNYKSIFQMIQNLTKLLNEMQINNKLPENFKVFSQLGLLE